MTITCTPETFKALKNALPGTRDEVVRRLKSGGASKAQADRMVQTGLWSGEVISVNGKLSLKVTA